MPDINGNYLGDQAGILPDNSANILHMADQYAQFNHQKQLRLQKDKEENDKRNEGFDKLVGTSFDPGKVDKLNPYAPFEISDITGVRDKWVKYNADAKKSKKPVDEGVLYSGITQDMGQLAIKSALAKQKYQQLQDAVAAIKGPGIDDQKTLGLAVKTGMFSIDPKTGKEVVNPELWDKNETGADVVKKVMEKYPSLVGNNQGVDEALAESMKKEQGTELNVPPVVDKNGHQISAGFKSNLKSYQEHIKDKDGNPIGIDIKQAPVYLPNGQPLLNPDGSQKRTIDPQVEHQYLQNHLGFALSVKSQLNDAIGEENQRRQEINANLVRQGQAPTLSMVTGDSEEAKVMNSDIVLNRLRSINQGGKLDIEASKDFGNRHKLLQEANEKARLNLAQANSARSDKRLEMALSKNGANTAPIDDFLAETDKEKGKDVKVEDMPGKPGNAHKWNPFKDAEPATPPTYKNVRIIPEDVDPRILDVIAGKVGKSGERRVPAQEFTDENGKPIRGWVYDAATANATGADEKQISNREVQRDYLNHNKKGVLEQLPKTDNKPKVTKVKGTDKKLF